MGLREPGESQQVVLCFAEHRLDLGQLPADHPGDDVELLFHVFGIRLR